VIIPITIMLVGYRLQLKIRRIQCRLAWIKDTTSRSLETDTEISHRHLQ